MANIVIKVSNDANMINDILNCNVGDTFTLSELMHHAHQINNDDLVLLVLGGDHSRSDIDSLNYSNGLKAIAKIIRTPEFTDENHYFVEIETLLVFNNTITKNDLYIYPQLKDIPNIGGSTKGVKNQAVSTISNEKFEYVLKALMDFDENLINPIQTIYNNFDNNIIEKYTNIEQLEVF